MTLPTWSPIPAPTFDLDTETARICAEVWAANPRPERIYVSIDGRRIKVGVPRVEDPDLFAAMVRYGLHDLIEGG